NVEEAFQAGKADIELQGGRLPATAGVLEALRNLAGVSRAAKEAVSNRAAASTPPPPPAAEKMFLRVRENFEIVEYAPLAQPVAPEGPPPAVPAEVLTKLKPHQIEGFAWLVRAWQSQRPGVLLADDMGLGKTLQALAFFAWLRRTEAVSQPILVVAPTGLLANWLNEIDEHLVPQSLGEIIRADGAGLAPIRGGPGTDIEAGGPRLDIETWRKAGVVLTTYETLRDYHMSFARLAFAVVVFD
ncbi:MAG: SNF2-related protein, partial [Myxococcota bacterium]|nr:SNF2-related protein [Myxococcota bacterium]